MKKYIVIPLVCLALLSNLVASDTNVWPQDNSDIQADPNVTFGQLDNGIRWAFMKNNKPEGLLSLRLLVKAGSVMEEDYERGLAHNLEHMAFNGSEHFPSGEIFKYGERNGLALGADTNANTSFLRTLYKLDLPNTDEDLVKNMLLYCHDVINGLTLSTEEINKERGVVLSEINRSFDADGKNYYQMQGFLLPHSKFSTRMPLGLKDLIANYDPQVIRDFYHKWYTPDRSYIIGVGDMDPKEFQQYLETYLGDIPVNETPRETPDLGQVQSNRIEAEVYNNTDLKTASVSISAVSKIDDPKDTKAYEAEQLKYIIASYIINRRFQKISQQEDSPITQGGSSVNAFENFSRNASITVYCNPENWKTSLGVAEQELRKALMYGFTEAELKEAVSALGSYFEQATKSANTRDSRRVSDSFSNSIYRNRVLTSPQQDFELFNEITDGLTVEGLHQAFLGAWNIPSRLVYVSGNFDDYINDADVMHAFIESSKKKVKANANVETAEWTYSDFGTPGTIKHQNYVSDLDVHQYQLSNNVYVNIKKTDYTDDQVQVKVRFGSGTLPLTKAQEGYCDFLSYTFTQGGLGDISFLQLNQLLAGKTIRVGLGIASNAFFLDGNTNVADLNMCMQLMAAYYTDPGFRPEAIVNERKSLDFIKNYLDKDISGTLSYKLNRYIASGDHRFGFPEMSVFRDIDPDSVKAWFLNILKNSRIEITIVGDVDPDSALKSVMNTFGCLPEREPGNPDYDDLRHVQFCGPEVHEFDYDSSSDKAAVGIVFKTTDCIDSVVIDRRLGLLTSVLQSRMWDTVREEMGATYSPTVYNSSSDTYVDYGTLTCFVLCKPDDMGKILPVMGQVSKNILSTGITEDEFNRALNPSVTSREKTYKTNGFWVNKLSDCQENPKELDWIRSYKTGIKSVTVKDLNDLAKKYLDLGKAFQFTVKPVAK